MWEGRARGKRAEWNDIGCTFSTCSLNTLDSKETCSVRLRKIYQDLQHRAHRIFVTLEQGDP